MYKIFIVAVFLLVSGFQQIVSAQFVIKGKVQDANSKMPLANASVYCENTTLFTMSDQNGNFSLSLSPGGYNLVVSHTGYKNYQSQVLGADEHMVILLTRDDKKLKEVVVSAKSRLVEDGWNNYGSFFIKNFIGSTPNAAECVLLNQEVLKFYYYSESNKVKVLATGPLKISNKALGYTLNYSLDSFVYYFDDAICAYQGICRYTEMQGTDSEKKRWTRNRRETYKGSMLQFMRNYYNSTLAREGWDIALQQKEDPTTFDRVVEPYDTAYYIPDPGLREVTLYYPRRIRVMFKKIPEPEYIERYGLPVNTASLSSAIDIKDKIIINENGYFYHPLSWVSHNYWSWKNLADQLPFDYKP
jgi:hypothetical protein